jgi:hypothetical protein
MAAIIKHERIDAQNIRKWYYDNANLIKTDLNISKNKLEQILALSDEKKNEIMLVMQFNQERTLENFNAAFQERLDEVNYQISLWDKESTNQTIKFINE